MGFNLNPFTNHYVVCSQPVTARLLGNAGYKESHEIYKTIVYFRDSKNIYPYVRVLFVVMTHAHIHTNIIF